VASGTRHQRSSSQRKRLDSQLYRLAAGPISVTRCIVYINTHRRCGRYHRLPLCGNASERASERAKRRDKLTDNKQRTTGRKRSDVTLYHSRGFIHTLSRGGLPSLYPKRGSMWRLSSAGGDTALLFCETPSALGDDVKLSREPSIVSLVRVSYRIVRRVVSSCVAVLRARYDKTKGRVISRPLSHVRERESESER